MPRLFLFAPYYLATDGLVAVSRMPVDVAEYYFHALLEASLDLGSGGAAYAAWAEARAAELMSEVPAAQRRQAYRAALSDFGAHLLSIANEISRAARRQAAAGRDICRLLGVRPSHRTTPRPEGLGQERDPEDRVTGALGRPASLFGHWERSFSGGNYRDGYHLSSPGLSSPGRREESRQPLGFQDKERFLREVLGATWSGCSGRDFAALCPSISARP